MDKYSPKNLLEKCWLIKKIKEIVVEKHLFRM
jgi:hypothetical protein